MDFTESGRDREVLAGKNTEVADFYQEILCDAGSTEA